MDKPKGVYIAVGIVALAAVVFFVTRPAGKSDSEILVLCGGSMAPAIMEIIEEYKSVSDDKAILSTGGSGALAAQIKHTRKGDVFVCHDPFMPWAEKHGLVGEWRTVAKLRVVIAVPEGNPGEVRGLKDLARPGLRVGVGNPDRSTSGVITKEILKRVEYGKAIEKNSIHARVHGKRATDLALGHLDAAIIWNAVAHTYRDKLDAIPIDNTLVDAITSATYGRSDLRNVKVTIGIVAGAKGRENVRRFWEFATTRGKEIFARHGFTPARGPDLNRPPP
ncbi:MAG: molybdate ABC transporter substrate-binding protein [Planctomycetota bacterium]